MVGFMEPLGTSFQSASDERMAKELPELLNAGARLVGGCCGTTPDTIAAFKIVVDRWNEKRRG